MTDKSISLLERHLAIRRDVEEIKRSLPIWLANRYLDGFWDGRAEGVKQGMGLTIIFYLPVYYLLRMI